MSTHDSERFDNEVDNSDPMCISFAEARSRRPLKSVATVGRQPTNTDVLIIATTQGTDDNVAAIAEQLGVGITVAATRGEGLVALRRSQFDVIVVEESLVEGDAEWADRVWQSAANGMPLVLSFARSGRSRLARELGAALRRRAADRALARRAVEEEMANALKSPITGLLLHSELIMRDPSIPAAIQPKLLHIVELASSIRERLGPGVEGSGNAHSSESRLDLDPNLPGLWSAERHEAERTSKNGVAHSHA